MALNGSDDAPPVIGLTTYLQQAQTGVWDVRASFLPAIYIEGVTSAGGIADAAAAAAGRRRHRRPGARRARRPGHHRRPRRRPGDLRPAARTRPPTSPRGDRDAWEFALVRRRVARAACRCSGICRGAQVLNVALGGTLHQHLPDVVGHYQHQLGNAVFSTSSIQHRAGHPAGRADRRRPPTRSATTTRPSPSSARG